MIRVRLQIGDSSIEDTFAKWGLVYLGADNRTEAPIKARDSSSYINEPGEHIDPRTVQDVFDYNIQFLIEAPNKELINANAKIDAFNKALYKTKRGTNIRVYETVTFYNDYKRVKIVGIPEPITEPTKFYRCENGRVMDCVVVEFKIHVPDPTLCDFSI